MNIEIKIYLKKKGIACEMEITVTGNMVHVLLDIAPPLLKVMLFDLCLSKLLTIYLMQNFMAEAANAAAAAAAQQDHMGGSINQGYNSYPTNAPVYASPPSSAPGHAASADYGPVYGTNYGY